MDFIPALLAQQQPEQSTSLQFIDSLARTPLSKVVMFVAVCTAIRIALYPFLAKTAIHKRGALFGAGKFLNEFLDAVVYAGVFVFLLIRPFAVQTFFIPSGSMLPTLQLQDYIVANKMVYRYSEPEFQDIIVFKPPQRALRPGQGESDFIKRLIGVPGSVVEIKSGKLFVDGKQIEEPYLNEEASWDFKLVERNGEIMPLNYQGTAANSLLGLVADEYLLRDPVEMTQLIESEPQPVPPGHFLMMGDNRNQSSDGRAWGLIRREDVIGRSEFVWWPMANWHKTR